MGKGRTRRHRRRQKRRGDSKNDAPQVLIVTDKQEVKEAVRERFEAANYRVETQSDGTMPKEKDLSSYAGVVVDLEATQKWDVVTGAMSSGVAIYARIDDKRTLHGPSSASPDFTRFVSLSDAAYQDLGMGNNGEFQRTSGRLLDSRISALEEEVRLSHRQDPSLLHELGRAYLSLGDCDKAQEVLREALSFDSENNTIKLDLAEVSLARNELDHAEEIAKQTGNGGGRRESILGASALRRKHLSDAISWLRKALETNPELFDAKIYLLGALAERGTKNAIQEAYNIWQGLFEEGQSARTTLRSIPVTEGGIVTGLMSHEGSDIGIYAAGTRQPRRYTANYLTFKPVSDLESAVKEVANFERLQAHKDELQTITGKHIHIPDFVRLLQGRRANQGVLVYPFMEGFKRTYEDFLGLQDSGGSHHVGVRFAYAESLVDMTSALHEVGTRVLELDNVYEHDYFLERDPQRGLEFHTFLFLRGLGFLENLRGRHVSQREYSRLRTQFDRQVSYHLHNGPEWQMVWWSDANIDNSLRRRMYSNALFTNPHDIEKARVDFTKTDKRNGLTDVAMIVTHELTGLPDSMQRDLYLRWAATRLGQHLQAHGKPAEHLFDAVRKARIGSYNQLRSVAMRAFEQEGYSYQEFLNAARAASIERHWYVHALQAERLTGVRRVLKGEQDIPPRIQTIYESAERTLKNYIGIHSRRVARAFRELEDKTLYETLAGRDLINISFDS
ncbi:hypothetical protein GF342_02080 [Candidatus Woesearchaeota archaeon]|nr:hypothetical protein [Candidatus Woesearchaeota archaeon]